jgi:hypothetical protein
MDFFEIFQGKIREVSDQKLNETISKGALKMSDEQIATTSFAFWLVYMAETDLNTALSEAWSSSKSLLPNAIEAAEKMLKEMIPGKREVDINDLQYFSEKIKVYEALMGATERTKLLWKFNDIRNDLSHNRIDKLAYNDEVLSLRETKEKVLIDYFRTALNPDLSQSKVFNSLSAEQKAEIEQMMIKAGKEK